MLEYAFIVPHSPLLSTKITKKHSLPAKTNASFDTIAKTLEEKKIKHIVTLGSYPKFDRDYFSTYIASQYKLTFPEFGDLITSIEVKPWFTAIQKLRETFHTPPLEILSHQELDYTHGIPLMHLTERFQGQNQLSIIPINDSVDVNKEHKVEFGKNLRDKLDELNVPYAVMCSGDLFATMEQTNSKSIHQENKKIKLALEKKLDFTIDPGLGAVSSIKPPTLVQTLPILQGCLSDQQFTVEEIAFETVNQTSFYFAGVNLSH